MKRGTQNVACYADVKYIAIAKACLLGLTMAKGHCIGKDRGKNKISVALELNKR